MRRTLLVLAVAVLVLPARAPAWTWPTDGAVLRPFVLGSDPYAAGQHRGVDLAGEPGSPVRAAAGGTVTFAGTVPGGGKTLSIRSDDYSVTLQHLGTIGVDRGAGVDEGDAVATVGDEGFVYLGIRVAAEPEGYVDPLALLPPRLPALPPPAAPAAPANVAAPAAAATTAPPEAPPPAVAPPAGPPPATPPIEVGATADAPAAETPAVTVAAPAAGAAHAAAAAPEPAPVAVQPPAPAVEQPLSDDAAADAAPTSGAAEVAAATVSPALAPDATIVAPLPSLVAGAPAVVGGEALLEPARAPAPVIPAAGAVPPAPSTPRLSPSLDVRRREASGQRSLSVMPRPRADRLSISLRRPTRASGTVGGIVLLTFATLGAGAIALIGARIISVRGRTTVVRSENSPEDPGRPCVAVREWTATPGPRRRARGTSGHLRPLSPPEGKRRADGERNRRARDSDHGRGRQGERLAA
jgi:hypothetical protein